MKTFVELHMLEAYANHVLEPHVDTPEVKGWYLRLPEPKRRMMSTLILFTREGIIICGDMCPNDGVISNVGYGLEWFVNRNSDEGYLCSKFLRQEWVPTLAATQMRERICTDRRSDPDAITKEMARTAYDDIVSAEPYELTPERVREIADDCNIELDGLGNGYEPGAAGWLVTIQRAFARLYAASTVTSATVDAEPDRRTHERMALGGPIT